VNRSGFAVEAVKLHGRTSSRSCASRRRTFRCRTCGQVRRHGGVRPPGALRYAKAPRPRLLQPTTNTAQITSDSRYGWMRNGYLMYITAIPIPSSELFNQRKGAGRLGRLLARHAKRSRTELRPDERQVHVCLTGPGAPIRFRLLQWRQKRIGRLSWQSNDGHAGRAGRAYG
jgi:hypothetical protein